MGRGRGQTSSKDHNGKKKKTKTLSKAPLSFGRILLITNLDVKSEKRT